MWIRREPQLDMFSEALDIAFMIIATSFHYNFIIFNLFTLKLEFYLRAEERYTRSENNFKFKYQKMPWDNCCVVVCTSNRREKGLGIFKLPSKTKHKEWREKW